MITITTDNPTSLGYYWYNCIYIIYPNNLVSPINVYHTSDYIRRCLSLQYSIIENIALGEALRV